MPSPAAISEARARRKSPARIATRFPQRALALWTPLREPASSITSSWYSEPMWTSSTETAPCTTLSPAPDPVEAAAVNKSAGRRRFPPAFTRYAATSLSNGSGDATAFCSSDSTLARLSSSPGRSRSSQTFITRRYVNVGVKYEPTGRDHGPEVGRARPDG